MTRNRTASQFTGRSAWQMIGHDQTSTRVNGRPMPQAEEQDQRPGPRMAWKSLRQTHAAGRRGRMPVAATRPTSTDAAELKTPGKPMISAHSGSLALTDNAAKPMAT